MRNKTRRNKTHRNKTKKNKSNTVSMFKHFFSHQNDKSSYSPTINNELETLQSIPRQELSDCNIVAAYKLKEPLKIRVSSFFNGDTCVNYDTLEAKRFLLKNLSANKHVDVEKIVTPRQFSSNCWFNTMFVIFFVSDKGRKFFHFFRHLMIEGEQKDGTYIPDKLKNAFALLNFAIDACLTGNKYAYKLNTNVIINEIYKAIPDSYKKMFPVISNVGKGGNPIYYYMGIINYLNNNSINMLLINDASSNWKNEIMEKTRKNSIPHIIILAVYENNAKSFKNKPVSFILNGEKYKIDSTIVRDVSKQHFCSTVTCEGKEFGYDGYSFHKLEPLEWRDKLNADVDWYFEETNKYLGMKIKWNYTKSYQMLLYYRI
jgi:hypothetical protein